MQEQPYFMSDKSWYRFDEKQWKYILTEKAPSEAVKSYNDFYRMTEPRAEESNGD